MNTKPSDQDQTPENQPKLDPKKVEVKDLDLKARQLRVRGGAKCLGRAISSVGGAIRSFGSTVQQ
jgi:hypothetical protein